MGLNTANLLEAQTSVLGSILLEPSIIGSVLAKVKSEDFTDRPRKHLFETVRTLFSAGKPVDAVTVAHAAGEAYKDLILDIMSATPTAANWEAYAAIQREQALLWRLQSIGNKLSVSANVPDAQKIISEANGLFCQRPGVKKVNFDQGLVDFIERQKEKPKYLKWGYSMLDNTVYAERGDFIIIGGRPSAGKTLLGLGFALYMASYCKVGVFSLETSDAKIYDRIISQAASINFEHIKKRELSSYDWDLLNNSSKRMLSRDLTVIPSSGMSVHDIQSIALQDRYDVIFIDYIQLIKRSSGDGTSADKVAEISRSLHSFAQSSGTTVIGLAQLSRPERDGGAVKAPTMASLKESGQLEQDADVIMLLYETIPGKTNSERALKLAKNKEGETGYVVDLRLRGEYQQFYITENTREEPPAWKARAARRTQLSQDEQMRIVGAG